MFELGFGVPGTKAWETGDIYAMCRTLGKDKAISQVGLCIQQLKWGRRREESRERLYRMQRVGGPERGLKT